MRLTRIYLPTPLHLADMPLLDANASNHLLRVLRLNIKDRLIVFDGCGNEFMAEIIAIDKRLTQVLIKEAISPLPESLLAIHLGQAISRGEKMDYTLQKAVELGVQTITPLFTERSGVKLAAERLEHRLDHWRKIVISACEQSGRSYLPSIEPPQPLLSWLQQRHEHCKLLFHPGHSQRLHNICPTHNQVCLLVGPEGGFADNEVTIAQQQGFETLSLGPRILRTETAAPAAITALQCLWGDMG